MSTRHVKGFRKKKRRSICSLWLLVSRGWRGEMVKSIVHVWRQKTNSIRKPPKVSTNCLIYITTRDGVLFTTSFHSSPKLTTLTNSRASFPSLPLKVKQISTETTSRSKRTTVCSVHGRRVYPLSQRVSLFEYSVNALERWGLLPLMHFQYFRTLSMSSESVIELRLWWS